MDMQMNRNELLELVVHYGNSMEHDILSNIQIEDQNSSSDNDSQSSKEKDSDMDVDEEEKFPNKISKHGEKDRASFLQLLQLESKFDTQSKISQSRKISWSKSKTSEFLIIIKPIENFHKTIEAEESLLKKN